MKKNQRLKIKKGDRVKVLLGKDRGREGMVKMVLPKEKKVLVEGINLVKKHIKSRGKDKPGGILEIEQPILVSKVAVICPECKKPTRVGYQITSESKKIRICRHCKNLLNGAKNVS